MPVLLAIINMEASELIPCGLSLTAPNSNGDLNAQMTPTQHSLHKAQDPFTSQDLGPNEASICKSGSLAVIEEEQQIAWEDQTYHEADLNAAHD